MRPPETTETRRAAFQSCGLGVMRLLGLALPDGNQGLAATVASHVLARQQRSHLKTLPSSDSVLAFASKGDPADSVFYIQKGKVKVTVVFEARQGSSRRNSWNERILR